MSAFTETFPGPGTDQTWAAMEAGHWTVASGLLKCTNLNEYSFARCETDLESEYYTATANVATLTPLYAEFGLFVRAQAATTLENHSYQLYIDNAGDWTLTKWVSGVATRVDAGTNNPGAVGSNALISLGVTASNVLEARLNGTLVTSAPAAEPLLATGRRVGLMLLATTSVDDCAVETLIAEDDLALAVLLLGSRADARGD